MHFAKLDDSPMFRQQLQCMEASVDLLGMRCLRFYKECTKYTEGLGEGCEGDIDFVNALESFGGCHNDHIGPVMIKFTVALREIGTFKDVLRSQIEHILNDRLVHFANVVVQEIKEARKRFDKASIIYDQAREKFLSLRKSTRLDVSATIEERDRTYKAQEQHLSKPGFIWLVHSLMRKLKSDFEFLEAVSGTVDAHLRFFKQGYELLHQMEPFINQCGRSCCTHQRVDLQAKEEANKFKRIEEEFQEGYSEMEEGESMVLQ